jgi:hypothetical protein
MTRIEPPEWATQPDLSITGVKVAEYAAIQRQRDKLLRIRRISVRTPSAAGDGRFC